MPRDERSFIEGVEKDLANDASRGTTPVTKRRVRRVMYLSGWKKRSPERLTELESLLAKAGIYADPDITDLELDLDTWIRFTREPATPVGKILKPERALGYHLSKYPADLEAALPDLGRLQHKSGGRKPEKIYGLDGEDVKPDLVFGSSSGKWLVCELERGDPKNESGAQLDSYVRAVSQHDREIVGLLVTGSPRTKGAETRAVRGIENLRRRGIDARWIVYDVAVRLTVK